MHVTWINFQFGILGTKYLRSNKETFMENQYFQKNFDKLTAGIQYTIMTHLTSAIKTCQCKHINSHWRRIPLAKND